MTASLESYGISKWRKSKDEEPQVRDLLKMASTLAFLEFYIRQRQTKDKTKVTFSLVVLSSEAEKRLFFSIAIVKFVPSPGPWPVNMRVHPDDFG
jgi:hypothetical protein